MKAYLILDLTIHDLEYFLSGYRRSFNGTVVATSSRVKCRLSWKAIGSHNAWS